MESNIAMEALGMHGAVLGTIRDFILGALKNRETGDPIYVCGDAALSILASHPKNVLELAYLKLNSWPFVNVPLCWRRLHEDASLFRVVQILEEMAAVDAQNHQTTTSGKRRKLNGTDVDCSLTTLVETLDKGIMLSGVPSRGDLFEQIFGMLDEALAPSTSPQAPNSYPMQPLPSMQFKLGVNKAQHALSLEDFQAHLDTSTTPLVIPGALDAWPALKLWQYPQHLVQLTLGGRRLVPVEIGRSYTDEDWGQQLLPFSRFLEEYVLPAEPQNIGYLAQHDLFQQLPALRNDILLPDYCYSTPPSADAATLKTAGLSTASQLDEPLLNAWFGPKGTKTPLHTDPYHNVLCQVVGYKYVRLYSPSETPKVYPRGVDENGINMENTSLLDVSFFRPEGFDANKHSINYSVEEFPLFTTAEYRETILKPGECLYIPLGWWHYVESLSTSFSVSFWWN